MASAATLLLLAPSALLASPGASAADALSAASGDCPQDVRRPRICFEPSAARVTITMAGPAPLAPSALRPDRFAVYEDGVLQRDVDVAIQRAPLTLGLLLEHGGRYHALDDAVGEAVAQVASALGDQIQPGDRTVVWTYGDRPAQVSQLAAGRGALQQALDSVGTAVPLSESNLYDALGSVLAQLRGMSGRKALILISTGVDTFSHTGYREVLSAASDSAVPIYAINLAGLVRQNPTLDLDSPPYSQLDFRQARAALAQLTSLSGGRLYSPDSVIAFSGIYDDLLERQRARYVLTYHSGSTRPPDTPRSVRVEVLAPAEGPPGAGGRRSRVLLTLEDSYVPRDATVSG